ncbi:MULTISPECIES: hypothetical protein [unclassified Carboxylicivirga]|uniref:hypothetical protein n=1 Tax=Carboxylicivirga TaxID=1628153 RepID=UPI003D32ADDE
MKKPMKERQDIDRLLEETLNHRYAPSPGFVDNVMARIDKMDNIKPSMKYISIGLQVAAACAGLILLINILTLRSSINQENENDWTSVYENNTSPDWYDYYNGDTFLATNINRK